MSLAVGVNAGRFDLLWQPGGNLKHDFVFKTDGSAVDITGVTVTCQVRDAPGETLLVDLSSSITVDGPNGKLSLDAGPAVTDLLLQHATWDLKISYTDASVDRLLEGRVILSPAVSV